MFMPHGLQGYIHNKFLPPQGSLLLGKSNRVKHKVKTRIQLISSLLGRALQTSRCRP